MTEYGKKLKKIAKTKDKKERFLRYRMWFSTLISFLSNDIGTIPNNIGNNVLIGNNSYATKKGITVYILVKEFSENTPFSEISEVVSNVKNSVKGVKIDTVIKNKRVQPDVRGNGIKSRKSMWEATLNNPFVSETIARRAARLLYTVDVVNSGEKVYRSHVYYKVSAPDGMTLNAAVQALRRYLDSIECSYKVIKSDVNLHFTYESMLSDRYDKKLKDVPTCFMSNETIAELLPNTQGVNALSGTLMGMDMSIKYPYHVNFRNNARAKNIYIYSKSGFGKTLLALFWVLDMYADGYNMCLMDIKGNELTAFTQAVDGYIISFREDSTTYVNTFIWRKEDCENNEYEIYANKMFELSKAQMLIAASPIPNNYDSTSALIDDFLESMYMSIGVSKDNPNTWERTLNLTPYIVFENFQKFISTATKYKYGEDVTKSAINTMKPYMSKDGSKSSMYKTALNYKDVLKTQVLTFDFGLINTSGHTDEISFRIKSLFMKIINDEYVGYHKDKGEWTFKLLEESQIASNDIIDMYVKDLTLGRSRNQVTALVGNSVEVIKNNPIFKAALDNISILALGMLNKSSIDYMSQEFSLNESDIEKLHKIASEPEYENNFLFINRMDRNATTGLVKALIPDSVRDGKLFKKVDYEEA